MAGEAPERVRLFLALDLPPDVRAAFARWRDSVVRDADGLRPVADEALHVTLVFLGRRPREDLGRIWEIAAGSLHGLAAPLLGATGFRLVPPRRARLVAIDLHDEAGRAGAVHEALAGALEAAGLYERERRPFWPHATAARVRPRARVKSLRVPPPPAEPFTAGQVTLYRSDLHPSGAHYVALERTTLEGL